jgi:hypothetical protein
LNKVQKEEATKIKVEEKEKQAKLFNTLNRGLNLDY